MLLMILGSVALAGVCALSIASKIVATRASDQPPPPYLKMVAKLATGSLGIGVGAFVMAWVSQ